MKLENEFVVKAPIDQTWSTLLDMQRVAQCLPGASLEQTNGDGVFQGSMKVKLGPMVVDYRGTARLLDVDEDTHTTTIEAKAREAKGQGTASALISNRLSSQADGTKVTVETELNVTGRQAQFGRGIMQDVASKMLGDFARRLEQEILSGGDTTASADVPAASRTAVAPAAHDQPEGDESSAAQALDLGSVVSGPLLKRAAPAAGGALVLLLGLGALVRRGSRRRRGFSLSIDYR